MRILLGIAAAWAAGALIEEQAAGALGMAAWTAAFGASALLAFRWRRLGPLLWAAAASGALASATVRERRANPPPLPAGVAVFEGTVARPVERGGGRRRLLIDVSTVVAEGESSIGPPRPLAARLEVTAADDSGPPPLPGDQVRFRGEARPPRGYRNEGAFDRARFAAGRGIDGHAAAAPPGVVRRNAPPAGFWVWRQAARFRARGAQVLADSADPGRHGSALVGALVLGDRGALAPELEEAFRRAGVTHVLSVSGLHLAAVALLVFAVTRWAWLRAGTLAVRVPAERVAALVAAPGAIAYTLVTGAEVATVRALVAALVALGGAVLGRRVDGLTALAAAALAILVASPWAIHEPSFQLSFAAAAMLAALGRAGAPPAGRWRRLGAFLARLAAASAAATVATAPLTALHFGVVQPAGVVANLLVVPVAELVVLPLGLAGVLIGALVPALGAPVVAAASWVAELLARAVLALAPHAPVLDVPPPRPLELVILGVGIVALAVLRPFARGAVACAASFAVALASILFDARIAPASRRDAIVTFLDVGQGDAAVVEAPGGETWLIDAGGRLSGDDDAPGADPGEAAVWRFLQARRIGHLDLVVVSHPHPDHYGGLNALARHVAIDELWITGDVVEDDRWNRLLAVLAARGTTVRRPPLGVARERAGARLWVLAPRAPGEAAAGADPYASVNDNSLVVRLEHAGRSVLFAGDLEEAGEAALVAGAPLGALAADVVKIPHHGSRTSSSPAFVKATRPRLAVVSLSAHNRFGHPAPEVLARWQAVGARVLRTDRGGAVTVTLGADGALRVETFVRDDEAEDRR